jgi:8-hydroxy-5-deazaflavin:NADPH oxidoreductase
MDIAIIGAGNVGKALAGSAGRAGHVVTIAAASPQSAEGAARETGATAAASSLNAVEGAEAVVLAVPGHALDEVLAEVGDALRDKIVIEVTNRVDPQDPGSVLDGTSNSERVQARVPGARVVKAFNTVFASRQADPVVDGIPLDGFVAGDDEEAKAKVMDLMEGIGFRPIDAGPLVMARALEAMAMLIIGLQIWHGWSWQSGWKLIGPLAPE